MASEWQPIGAALSMGLGAVGSAAAATIGEQIPVGQSQWAKFVSNLSNTSSLNFSPD